MSWESFKGYFTAFGQPVALIDVINEHKLGARLAECEPTVFHFYKISKGQYMLALGDDADGQYIGLNASGYLCLNSVGEIFNIGELDGATPVGEVPGETAVYLTANSDGACVMLFGGADAFDDPDVVYNFLIAGRKLKRFTENKGVFYVVPNGRGTWEQFPADQRYIGNATPLMLNVL